MKKIDYPSEQKAKEEFHKDYLSLFSDRLSSFENSPQFAESGITIEQLLTGNFEVLLERLETLQRLGKTDGYLEAVGQCFNYTEFQPRIALFFMQHADQLRLSTCFYCNIDYINIFEYAGDYFNIYDFLNRGHKEDLKTINGIGDTTAQRIINIREANLINSIADLDVNNGIKNALNAKQVELSNAANPPAGNIVPTLVANKRLRNHFTLDHVIPKTEYPLLALSLYNLVPCCYNCNSKFKGKKSLFERNEAHYLSPSSNAFDFDQQVHFRLLFRQGGWSDVLKVQDIALDLQCKEHPEEYEKYIRLFKLEQRYAFHKYAAISLIDKRKQYSDSQLQEIAKLIEVPIGKVKADIFGEDIFGSDCEWRPLTKLKRDIAWNIGISGVVGKSHDKL